MRLGLDARILAHPYSGISSYLVNLIKEFRRKGIGELILFSDKPILGLYQAEISGIPQVIFGERVRKRWGRWLLPLQLAKNRVDLYHALWNFSVPLWSPCPVVLTIYDLFPLLFPATIPRVRKRLRYQWNLLFDAGRANRVITISESTKRDLKRCLKLPERKIRVIPLGIDLKEIEAIGPAHTAKWRKHFGLEDPYLIAILGRVAEKRKNSAILVQAFKEFKAEYPQTQLVIVGTGTTNGIERDPTIRVLEGIPREALLSLLQGASLMIHPTLYEGFGLPLLEAMASGTPVIAGEVGSVPEVVGDSAMLVDPMDVNSLVVCMRRLTGDPSLRNQLIRRGEERAGQYTWDKTAEETLRVYEELAKIK